MRFFLASGGLFVVCLMLISTAGQTQEPDGEDTKGLSSNQALMRDKLVQMNRILEGITLDQFKQVQESAKTLKMISQATSWHVVDPTPRYERLSKNFQEQAMDLERHAHEQNVEAATLDLVRLNITCTECHEQMRNGGE